MIRSLIDHTIKRAIRNFRVDLTVLSKLLLSVSILYSFIILFYFGFDFERIAHIIDHSNNPILLFNHALFHIVLIVFFLQLFTPVNPIYNLLSYLHLPIKRNEIILQIIIYNIINPILIGFLIFFIPYSIKIFLPAYNLQEFLTYTIGILLLLVSISLLSLLVRNLIGISFAFVALPFGLTIFLYLMCLTSIITFKSISIALFEWLSGGNVQLIVIFSIIITGLILLNIRLLRENIYKLYQIPKVNLSRARFVYFDNSTKTFFDYILLELKLIMRNKRLRGFFLIAIILLVLFYKVLPQNDEGLYFTFIVYILLSGMFGYIFSQYMFSWESSFFDFILSKKFDILIYLKAKYLVYLILGLIVFIVFLPVVKPSKIELHLFFSALLYNSSFGYFICFFLATFNTTRIDLSGNLLFNYQGLNIIQVFGLLIILIVPIVTLSLLSIVLDLTQSLLIINFFCFIGLLNQQKGWQIILKQLNNRKYINTEGYRK